MLRKQSALLILFILIFLQVTSCGGNTGSTLPGPAPGDEYDLDISIELMLLKITIAHATTTALYAI